jgi:hypothetical protein
LVSFHGQLLVAVDNERRGFDFGNWRTGFKKAQSRYGNPFCLREPDAIFYPNAQTLAVWRDSLYIVAGVSSEEVAGKYKKKYQAGGFELLRLHEDGDWDSSLERRFFFPGNQGTSGRLRS